MPGTWQHSYYGQNLDNLGTPACPTKHDSEWGPGTFERATGSSYIQKGSFGATVSADGKSGTFQGNAVATMSKSSGRTVTHQFVNSGTGNKKLCGLNTKSIAGSGLIGPIVAVARL